MSSSLKTEKLQAAVSSLRKGYPEVAKYASIKNENGEPTLRIKPFGTKEEIILTYDMKVGMYKPDGFQSAGGLYVRDDDLDYYMKTRGYLINEEAKPGRLLRKGLVAAGIAGAVLFACGKSKADEAPVVPDQDQPVVTQFQPEP